MTQTVFTLLPDSHYEGSIDVTGRSGASAAGVGVRSALIRVWQSIFVWIRILSLELKKWMAHLIFFRLDVGMIAAF